MRITFVFAVGFILSGGNDALAQDCPMPNALPSEGTYSGMTQEQAEPLMSSDLKQFHVAMMKWRDCKIAYFQRRMNSQGGKFETVEDETLKMFDFIRSALRERQQWYRTQLSNLPSSAKFNSPSDSSKTQQDAEMQPGFQRGAPSKSATANHPNDPPTSTHAAEREDPTDQYGASCGRVEPGRNDGQFIKYSAENRCDGSIRIEGKIGRYPVGGPIGPGQMIEMTCIVVSGLCGDGNLSYTFYRM
ncbi:hypothetical protein [Iodidimonas sp. SYSU 1G8]|uniref:hypothetical protein n=1 Tax=Iodidimonas sp. SYSU 1G8 TaxID=3133967 RepID=UPI0031FE5FED